jgi:hypothetical protein
MYYIHAIALFAALASACPANYPGTQQPYGQCLFSPITSKGHFDADFRTIQAVAKTTMAQRLALQAGPASIPTHGTHSAFPLRQRYSHNLPPQQCLLARPQPSPPPKLPLRAHLALQRPLVPSLLHRARHTRRPSRTTAPAIASDLQTVRPTPRPVGSSPPQASRQPCLRISTGLGRAPEQVQLAGPAGRLLARPTRVAIHCPMLAPASL